MKKIIIVFLLSLIVGIKINAQCLTVTSELQDIINEHKSAMNDYKLVIEGGVANAMTDVYINNGVPSYENWVRFLEVADDLEELNARWDSAYAEHLAAILISAYQLGLCEDLVEGNQEQVDCAEDLLESNYFIYPEEYASVYFESQLNFTSYRVHINQLVTDWLAEPEPQIDQDPSLMEDIDEEFWSCIDENVGFEIRDENVDETLLDGFRDYTARSLKFNSNPGAAKFSVALTFPFLKNSYYPHMIDWDKVFKTLARIKDAALILTAIVTVVEGVRAMMADCGESQEGVARNNKYDGFLTNSGDRVIGYKLEQRSVTFDMKASNTKIRGKAKLYKRNSNGKITGKDRRGKVGIEFCTRQWDVCNKVDYPVDASLIVPVVGFKEHTKKVKLSRNEGIIPFALALTKAMHFLSFSFSYKGMYEKTIPVLAINTPVTARCR